MKLFRLLTGVILIGLSSLCPAQTACRTVYSESQFSSKTLYPDVSLKMIFQLSDISQTADFQRGPRMKAAWRRYKNTPGPQSVLIDLGDPNLFNPSPLLNSYNAKIKYSKYDEVTALLRQGDRVKLGDRIYTLGEFLGAGNATHIYANADDPTTAILIP